MKHTKLTVKNNKVTSAQLASFLKKHIGKDVSLQYYLNLAKEMIAGKEYQHDYRLYIPENDLVTVSEIEVLNEYQLEAKEREEKQAYYDNLRVLGAAGDSQAAIEFCKAIEEGHYNLYISAFA